MRQWTTRISCALVILIGGSAIAEQPAASSSSTASASPEATLEQSVSHLSAQSRSKISRAGAAYGRWLDQVAKSAGNAFFNGEYSIG